ncbi:hypothetical protein P3T20_004991, partial [Paraburkholderia sp. GAS206C]|uniref:hypothetical protein n=1 Tax=Paraburkholderia sp. GAS206C TaxID=3035128 RepID=UPI003D22ED18
AREVNAPLEPIGHVTPDDVAPGTINPPPNKRAVPVLTPGTALFASVSRWPEPGFVQHETRFQSGLNAA